MEQTSNEEASTQPEEAQLADKAVSSSTSAPTTKHHLESDTNKVHYYTSCHSTSDMTDLLYAKFSVLVSLKQNLEYSKILDLL